MSCAGMYSHVVIHHKHSDRHRVLVCRFPGRLGVFYGNKSSTSLQSFSTNIVLTQEDEAAVTVHLKPVSLVLEAGAQKQQVVDVECKSVFTQAPRISISFK